MKPTDPARITVRPAQRCDLSAAAALIRPFVARGELLPRPPGELAFFLPHAFVADPDGKAAGFAALEIYSKKLAEIRCLSVDEAYRGQGIGRRLVMLSVQRARESHVTETMAITAHEELLTSCGFDFCLPGPKTELFFRLGEE